jgi:hypothetical protein
MTQKQHDPGDADLLEPGERLHVRAEATDAVMLVTDRRVAVALNNRVAMAVPYEGLRRLQFDVERDRLATLALVPDRPTDTPQVLVIPPGQYRAVADAIATIGERIAAKRSS